MTPFLSLPNMIEFTFLFLSEGVKMLYRYTYAIVKCHKDFFKSINNPKQLLDAFCEHSLTNTRPGELVQMAYRLRVGAATKYHFTTQKTTSGLKSLVHERNKD
jgi:hypothetical protein